MPSSPGFTQQPILALGSGGLSCAICQVLSEAVGEDLAIPELLGRLFVTGMCPVIPKLSFFQSSVLGLAESRCDLGAVPGIQMYVEYRSFVKKPALDSAF